MFKTDGMEINISPYGIIYSLFGGYILPRGGEIWIGSLIKALAPLNLSEKIVRTTVSRMKQAGYLESRRVGQYSYYQLTEIGLEEIQRTGGRALGTSEPEWDGKWTVIMYSIPEERRELRDTLRAVLKGHGFGPVVPGAWIYPYPLPEDVEAKMHKIGAWPYLEIFTGEHMGTSDVNTFVKRAWPQLSTLQSSYLSYIAKYKKVLAQYEHEALSDDACFALRFRSLFEFIAVILEDPLLPPALLPDDWPRAEAQAHYFKVRETLAEPAGRFFNGVYQEVPPETSSL